MASPRHIPAAAAGSGNKENISEDGDTFLDCPTLRKEGSASTRRKKPAGFNLRKSIAWNPAFFTEEGVLDNSELSVLTGSQLMSNGSPSSGVSAITSPLCRSGRYANTYVLKEVAENSHGKLPAKHCSTENQGRKLFSSVKTPQKDERKESSGTQNSGSVRSTQKCIPRVTAGSIQKKVPNTSSTAQMSRIPKKSQPSLPMAPRSTSSLATVSKSNKKLAPVKAEHVHRVPGLPPKSKTRSISSGPPVEKDVVPAVTAICEEAKGSVKCQIFSPHPQSSPSSSFGGTASTFAKPSALRMPSPSVGFFTQENAHVSLSHSDAAKRNVGRCFARNTSSVVKPPRYKQPEDLKSSLRLTKPLSTNCHAASNLLVLPVTRESNPNTLVGQEKESLSKATITYSTKYQNANNQERPGVDCLLTGSGATTQPLSSEKNDGARNSVPTVYNDASHVEGRDVIKEIEHIENSYSLRVICSSTIQPVEDYCSLKAPCSSTKPIVASKLSLSCISSQGFTSNDLDCQSKSDSGSSAVIDLETSFVGETALAVSLSEGDSCAPCVDLLQDFGSCDYQNTVCSNLMEPVESTICVDQLPHCDSSSDEMPALADSNSDMNNSLCNDANRASSEEQNTDDGMELETNNPSAVKDTPLLHVECDHNHNYRSTECSMNPEEERGHVLLVEPNMEDNMVLDTNKSVLEGASHIEKNKAPDRSQTNTIFKDHLKNLVPFTEEWLAVMEARGQEVLEQKTGTVQNSPPDKTAPEPSPWSPVKRKAQDVGPFDCTKYSKSVRTSGTP
ncbi:uncharacterized protein LOC133905878 isoform X2 [Phragmites australis]|uniref:uncharacterized protein LOC133905878 isoform X2 n=1 Tax=Phragmites australis TaxID=29695 RepID=UPI002D7990A9|nr:uncharacterized protein LOC133905878 isoform X2 [Phragmites australis]